MLQIRNLYIVHKIWSIVKRFCTHPQSIIIDYYQGKLMTLVNLVFSSDKHLNHLLAYVECIRFRPGWADS